MKNVDAVYKEARLLRASVKNSEKIDRALEKIINILFYTVLTVVVLAIMQLDPLALFLSLSSVLLAFAFMFSTAASKMFEGWLFILVRSKFLLECKRVHVAFQFSSYFSVLLSFLPSYHQDQ